MISKSDLKSSIFMSLVLRHKPQEIGLSLDEYGYVYVDDLIRGMNNKGFNVTMEDIKRIVAEDDKQRYSFNDNEAKIRANQGHSIKVNLELKPIKPPKTLYHGTGSRFVQSILKEGIRKQKRQYVHLSSDKDTAVKVGKRHGGNLVIFTVDSEQMYKDGFKFYLSDNKVWLIDYVPSKYIDIKNN